MSDVPAYAHFVPLRVGILLVLGLPGILGGVWLRSSIRTRAQQIGALLLSIWLVGFVGLEAYALHWVATHTIIYYFGGVLRWTNALGLIVFAVSASLLVIGMLLLWRDVRRNHNGLNPQLQPLK